MTLNETLRTIEDSNKGTERTWLEERPDMHGLISRNISALMVFFVPKDLAIQILFYRPQSKVVMGWLGILLFHFAVRILPWISFEPFLLSLISKHHPLMFSSCFFKTSFWSIFKNQTVVRWLRQWIVT